MSIADKTVLITGANRGIGQALADGEGKRLSLVMSTRSWVST
jgi:NAD(P)-dependent dehydrogenase (short-subunit alcohol dehydrogenase family)